MSDLTIYHNPKCSKSRQALGLLKDKGVEPEVVLYLDTPLSAEQISALLDKLGIEPHELLRKKEAEYEEAGLDRGSSREAIVAAIARFPRLLERPVIVRGERAVIGRPTERVLELL